MGAISLIGCLELQFTSTLMNSLEYITDLSYGLLLFLRENNNKKYVFRQGNDRIHVSRQSMEWFRNQSIEVLWRPACSPDMNIVEKV